MKYSLFALTIFFFGCTPQPKPSNCALFRNGKFLTKLNGHDYFIERSGATQKEYFFNGKDTVTAMLNVKWVDDCTYMLMPNEETRIKFTGSKNSVLTVSITGTTANSYTQKTTMSFSDKIYTSEFVKIK